MENSVRQVDKGDLQKYAKVFVDYFTRIFEGQSKYVSCNIHINMKGRYCAVELIIQDYQPCDVYTIIDARNQQMDCLNKFRLGDINELFYQDRDAIVFSENSFYVLKSNEAKNWHRAMAKLDLSDFINAIFQGGEGVR